MRSVFLSSSPPDRVDWLRFRGSFWAAKALQILGWRVDWHGLPGPRGVIIAYPHTSNWDFVVGILVKWTVGMPLRFWAKEGLFTGAARFTLGPMMRYWGAVRVDRVSSSGMIANTTAHMQASDYFWLALSPEGTRSYTPYLRSGFYRVALTAGCPLGLAYFDFQNKVVGVTEFITLTGDETADLGRISDYYAGKAHGCTPANAGTLTLFSR